MLLSGPIRAQIFLFARKLKAWLHTLKSKHMSQSSPKSAQTVYDCFPLSKQPAAQVPEGLSGAVAALCHGDIVQATITFSKSYGT